jgi:AraC family transcriptional regulator
MDLTPLLLREAMVPLARFQLVEWLWPDVIDFGLAETTLMLEMSLPPFQTDSTVEFPDLDPGNRCLMGSLFVRYPGVELRGRGDGGRIRVLRCIFAAEVRASLVTSWPSHEHLPLLRALLDIRDDNLRALMRIAHRELADETEPSPDVLGPLAQLLVAGLRRFTGRHPASHAPGRLAAWQYRRIRERLATDQPLPAPADLADLCGISARHLDRQFLALTGSTVAEYIDRFWLDRAKAMLERGGESIKAIAFACGFAHANSFARAFRRATGASPSAYRQASGEPGG